VTFKLIAMVVLVALTAMLVQPAKAEAMDPSTMMAIASAAVGVLLIVGFLVVANTRDSQQTGAATDDPDIVLGAEPIVLGPEPIVLGPEPIVLGAEPIVLGAEPIVLGPESIEPAPEPIVLVHDAGGVQAQ
jgi:hypothetical protein